MCRRSEKEFILDRKKIDFKISNENAWEIGLACGGDISIYIEEIK